MTAAAARDDDAGAAPPADPATRATTFLVEIAALTLPPRGQDARRRGDGGGGGGSRGMHVTASWVGPAHDPPSGRRERPRRREVATLHRTRTRRLVDDAAGCTGKKGADRPSWRDVDDGEEAQGAEHVFTVDDDALFLLRTSMTQLAGAAAPSRSRAAAPAARDHTDLRPGAPPDAAPRRRSLRLDDGGLRLDVYETPLDVISAVYATVLADSVAEKEAAATTREGTSSSYAGYRLVG